MTKTTQLWVVFCLCAFLYNLLIELQLVFLLLKWKKLMLHFIPVFKTKSCFDYFGLFFMLLFILISSCNRNTKIEKQDKSSENKKVFSKVSAEESGLFFKNTIKEDISTMENLFNYDYFYNGAGVGIADLNNDGLNDVFFCGNQVENKLFINNGQLNFTDISKKANINNGKNWANGITFVDINNDGWLDIYISQGGPKSRQERKNLLFINQKDETFKEEAEDYGLADTGISTQSVFFDFDNDNDLDCLVMNENEFYGVDPVNLYKLVNKDKESKYYNSSHLYRNDNGKFIDVTGEAGIESPIFGLGLTVSDINNDGWLDFYIASDYYIPDALFINNKNGSFSNKIKQYTNHISFYGMGMDIADINNDLKQDIFVLDMAANDHIRSKTLMASMNTHKFDYLVNKAGFHHQYMYNSLQLQTADLKFSNISQAVSIANTDWSWSVLMSDFNHDTHKDVFITNGYRRYALDNDLQNKVYQAKKQYRGNVPLQVKKQLYESMPSEKLPNILYQNKGNLKFKEVAKEWGLADFSFSNGAAQGDLDNDGDLDLVVNNIDDQCFLYQNLTVDNGNSNYIKVHPKGTLSESFARVTINYAGKSQMLETRRVRGYRSSHENLAHFGLGKHSVIDTITVTWPSGEIEKKYNVPANDIVIFLKEDAKKIINPNKNINQQIFKPVNNADIGLDFTHKENVYDDFEKEILLPYKQSTQGPYMAKGDANGDGLEDVYIGGASGQSGQLYLQTDSGNFYKKKIEAFTLDRSYEDMQSIFFDFDNDKDLDLFIVSGGNEFANSSSLYADRLYINDGSGNYSKAKIDELTINPKSGKSVDVIDFDKDGDLDILVGNRIIAQSYPNFVPSTLWKNDNGNLKDVTKIIAPELLSFGIINDVIATDFDSDGWTDFIAIGEWSEIGIFKNRKGVFSKQINQNEIANTKGWWFTIQETDINNDGLPDYILGNAGLNIKFKASSKKPFKVFANDFDNNGTPDIVLSKEYNGQYVPVRGRECSSQQMPFIQQKFDTYSKFANANLLDIYGDELNNAYVGEVNEFKSILLVNKGEGNFEKTMLPIEAQLFPIMKVVFKDLNGDGYEDAIIGGNIYETEVETPRLDAFSGLALLSNGTTGYYPMPWSESGILFNGNIKDLTLIDRPKKNMLLIASQNNGPLEIYSFK